MRARAIVPVAAIIGALVLNTSAARGQAAPPDRPASPDEPEMSVPKAEPGPEPNLVRPGSSRPAVGPTPALPGATPQAPSFVEPKVIHETRGGFVLAGTLTAFPAYLLQMLAAWGISYSATDSTCSSCYSKEAKLFLIPIVGPWLADRAAPQQEQGSSWPYLIWGGIEAAGVAMLLVGLAGEDVPREPVPQSPSLTLLPFVAPQAEGFSLLMHW